MKRRIGVLISGRGSNLAALIAGTRTADYPATIVLVISNRADAPGLALAKVEGISTATVDHRAFATRIAFDTALTEQLTATHVEFVCCAGFMRILSPTFIAHWRGRLINIHPSLLPAFRGLDTHQRVLDAGARITGATVHHVTEELDGGTIIAQTAVAVLPGDTAETLASRVLVAEHRLYPHGLRLALEDTHSIMRQEDGGEPLFSPPLSSGKPV